MFTSIYLRCSMEPDYYDYERQHAVRDDEHDYEDERDDSWDEDYWLDYHLEEGEYDTREDLGWDGHLED